jgi:sulfonate transport system permease protein
MMLLRALRWDQIRGGVPFAVLLLAWWLAAKFGLVNPIVLPPLGQVVAGFFNPDIAGQLAADIAASFVRLIEGGVLGASAGLMLGLALGWSPVLDKLVGPSFHAFRQVALFAWIPLLTAWLGGGDLAKVVFVGLAAFKPVVMGTYEGVRSVPSQYLDVGRAMCFSRRRMLLRIILPAALPSIIAALQLALISAWLGTIGAEYLMGGIAEGIGTFVINARETLQTNQVFVGIITIAIIGVILNKAVRWAGGRGMAWKA